MNWYVEALRKYATFTGRARRKEFWFFQLFVLLIGIALSLVDRMLGVLDDETGFGVLSGIFSLAMFLPNLAVSVRRLHDTDRSGWWLLLCFIPLIGIVVLLVFFVLDGTRGTNRFGEDPKGGEA
jgi:uncharacterized membrane protein YhaH (DUF805 family)